MILFFFASGRDIDYGVSSPYNLSTGPAGLASGDALPAGMKTHMQNEKYLPSNSTNIYGPDTYDRRTDAEIAKDQVPVRPVRQDVWRKGGIPPASKVRPSIDRAYGSQLTASEENG